MKNSFAYAFLYQMMLKIKLTFLCCLLSTVLFAQKIDTYLKNNSIDITNDIKTGPVLDQDFFNHQIFLLGESHGVQKPQEIDFNFLKLLNSKAGVHTYVAEIDFAKAYFLNQYLASGDEKLIDTVFADWVKQDAQWANKEFQDKIRKIRSLNLTLSKKDRITFAGIDKIQNTLLVADYFDALFRTKPFSSYKAQFSPLSRLLRGSAGDSLVVAAAKKLLTDVRAGKLDSLDPANKFVLEYALKNCAQGNAKRRETVLFENFKHCYQKLNWKKQKLYGFFGFFHVLQAKTNTGKGTSFVTMLLNDSDLNLKGKIASIGFMFVASKMIFPNAFIPEQWRDKGKHYTAVDKFNYDGPITTFNFIEDFKSVGKPNATTLIRLDGIGSVFTKQPIVVKYNDLMPAEQRMTFDEPGKNAANYFQYVILVRNSPAVTPIIP